MKRFTWKFKGRTVTAYTVAGCIFTGRGAPMRALSLWCKHNPKRVRKNPL